MEYATDKNKKFMRTYTLILVLCVMGSIKAIAQNGMQDSMGVISRELDEIVVTAPENQIIGNKTFFIRQRNLKMPQTMESNFLLVCKSPT